MTQVFAMSPEEKAKVMAIIDAHLPPEVHVAVFGSRAAGRTKPWSDLDLALIGPGPIPLSTLGQLREAFEASSLGWKVDIVDRKCVSTDFGRIIDESMKPLR